MMRSQQRKQALTLFERLLMRVGDSNTPSLCMTLEQLPKSFQVVSFACKKRFGLPFEISADLIHEKLSLRVKWASHTFPPVIKPGAIVSIVWPENLHVEEGELVIHHLAVLRVPDLPRTNRLTQLINAYSKVHYEGACL